MPSQPAAPQAQSMAERDLFSEQRRFEKPSTGWKVGYGMRGTGSASHEAFIAASKNVPYRSIDPTKLAGGEGPSSDVFKLLVSSIVPRPIALCSSLDEQGQSNLAPFSYFNIAGHDPPMLMCYFSTTRRVPANEPTRGQHRDTRNNILREEQFTVSIISEPFVEAAVYSSVDCPCTDEYKLSGLTPRPSDLIRPPSVAESALTMECVLVHSKDFCKDGTADTTGTLVVGKIVRFHVREDLFKTPGQHSVAIERLMPVAKLDGFAYAGVTDLFEVPQPKWASEKDKPEVQQLLSSTPLSR